MRNSSKALALLALGGAVLFLLLKSRQAGNPEPGPGDLPPASGGAVPSAPYLPAPSAAPGRQSETGDSAAAAGNPRAGFGKTAGPKAAGGGSPDPKAYLQAPPLSAKEIRNVRRLSGLFFRGQRGNAELNGFLRRLEELGLEPVVARNENPYTGKMLVVRSGEALEGTRYLHAQYFQDDELHKEAFRQHISFEIRPGPNAMSEARRALESLAGKRLGRPVSERGDEWVEWKLDGNSLWIHRLGPEDLKDHPFNAHSPSDAGTVKVGMELVPDEDHGSHRGSSP